MSVLDDLEEFVVHADPDECDPRYRKQRAACLKRAGKGKRYGFVADNKRQSSMNPRP